MRGGYKNFFFAGAFAFLMLVLPVFALMARAQATLNLSTPLPGVTNPIVFQSCAPGQQCSFNQLAQYIAAIYRYGVGLAVALAVMMIMIGGFIWVTAAGATDRVSKAKDFIIAALTGLVLALFSFLILYIVNPRLTQLQAINVAGITAPPPTALRACTGCCVITDFFDASGRPITGGGAPRCSDLFAAPSDLALACPTGTSLNSQKRLISGSCCDQVTECAQANPGTGSGGLPLAGQANKTIEDWSNGQAKIEPYARQVADKQGNTFVGGKATSFAGPNDSGVRPDETGEISGELLRSLDPNTDFYVAYRWDYTKTPLSTLQNSYAQIYNPATGQYVNARIVDWGPNPLTTNATVDTSTAVFRSLGATDGSNLYIRLVPKTGNQPGPTSS